MKKTLLTAALLMMPLVGAGAAWYDEDETGNDAYTQTGNDDDFLDYGDSFGVDPLYSTPGVNTGSGESRFGSRQKAFIPSNIYGEYFGNMSLNGSKHSHLHIFNTYLALPLTSSETSEWKGWHFDATASVRVTWLENSGRNILDERLLYTLGLQASVGHKLGERAYAQLGVVPHISSDFDVMSHEDFFLGCYGAVSVQPRDNFRFTFGLAYMPDYYEHNVFPMFNVAWRYSPSWEFQVQASRFSLNNVAHENFHWGPFFQWNSARWTVHRSRMTEQFSMTNCILGVGTTYNIRTSSNANVMLLGDLGCSFYNNFRIRDKKGHHTLEKYRAHPGLYMRVGVMITF